MHGAPTNFPLYHQVAHWQALQNYPQFALYGISKPELYWAIQETIDAGPASWERNRYIIQFLSRSSSNADFSPFLNELNPLSLERAIGPWLEHCHWLTPQARSLEEGRELDPQSLADIVSTIHTLSDTYFHSVTRQGWLETAAWLASNDAEEKPSRRCSYCLELLDIVHDKPHARWTILHQALEKERPAHLRYQAMRYLPQWIPTSNELRAWLETFSSEEDRIVRFWAAHHLSHMPLDPGQTWIAEALCQGFRENIDREYNASQVQCASYVVDDLDRLGKDYLYVGLHYLELQVTNTEVTLLPFAWRALLTHLHRIEPDNLKITLAGWRRALSPADLALWDAMQLYRSAVKSVIQSGTEILCCCNEESHPYYHALRACTENPWSYDAERLCRLLATVALIDSFRSFLGLSGRLQQMTQTLMELPLEPEHLSQWKLMAERLNHVAPLEAVLRHLAGLPSFRRQLALLTPILCADDLVEKLPGEFGLDDL